MRGYHLTGHLTRVTGSGSSGLYHLMINNYYWGQLWNTEHFGWKFASQTGIFEESYMVEYFAQAVNSYRD